MPFVRLLQRHPAVGPALLAELVDIDPNARLPIAQVHELLAGAVFLTGDPDIGLKAAREITPGEYGVIEYAASSAATWGEAIAAVGEYLRLVNDALRFSVVTEPARTLLQLESLVPLPRQSADFQSAAFHIGGSRFWPPNFEPTYEVWFTYPQPPDVTEYERTFRGGTLCFDAPFNGFSVPSEYLELPQHGADDNLHRLIRDYADRVLADLPRRKSLMERVRQLLAEQLAQGAPSSDSLARQLSMSRRTMVRRLEDEGTTFKELLEDVRRSKALQYVRCSDLSMAQIAETLGFSQVSAFHRAFRRWTGQTPLEYRRAQ
jgi:AraC-like DNA-binding protein